MTTPRTRPDALVFIPGIKEPWDGDAVDGLGARVVAALERNTQAHLRFDQEAVIESFEAPFDSMRAVRVSISADQDSPSKPVLDLYTLDLVNLVTEPYRVASPNRRIAELALQMLILGPRVIGAAFGRKNKGVKEQIHVVIGGGAVLVMLFSLLVLVATVAVGIVAAPTNIPVLDQVRDWALPFAGVALGALALLPQGWRLALDRATVFILSTLGYVAAGQQKSVVVGRLASFVREGGWARCARTATGSTQARLC